MSHLRRYLERSAAIAPERLDAALRRQQIYGGSLDSILLELGVCDPRTLCELLSQACGLPVVRVELLEPSVPRPWDQMPMHLVEIGWVVPLAMDGETTVVGVHPDLPNDRLGELYRALPHVEPLVTPECCLETINAERTRSVVPQRYAVLFASFRSALRQRPSVSDVGFPIVDLGRHEDTATGPAPAPAPPAIPPPDPFDSAPNPERRTSPYGADDDNDDAPQDAPQPSDAAFESSPTVPHTEAGERAEQDAFESAPTTPPFPVPPAAEDVFESSPTIPATAPAEPTDDDDDDSDDDSEHDAARTHPRARIVRPPSFGPPRSEPRVDPAELSEPARATKAPPIRFTARGTMIPSTDPLRLDFDGDAARDRVGAARSQLDAAENKDAVITALVDGAMQLTPRVALFRIKGTTLTGLTGPTSAFGDVSGKQFEATEAAVRGGGSSRWAGMSDDANLLELSGNDNVPCTLHRIDVASRPIMLLYADHGGREFLPAEANLLDELSNTAAAALERILRQRRGGSPDVSGPPSRMPTPKPTAPQPTAAEAPSSAPTPAGPPTAEPSPAPAPPAVQPAPELHLPPVPGPPTPNPSAVAALPQPDGDETLSGALLPPPDFGITKPPGWGPAPAPLKDEVVQPQPANPGRAMRRETQVDGSSPVSGPPSAAAGFPALPHPDALQDAPRFVPPPLDALENAGIIPLSSPIGSPLGGPAGQTSARGRIQLDDEDLAPVASAPDPQPEDRQAEIEALLVAIASNQAELDDVRTLGEPAYAALAEQFPGPLEVLRRDLRALAPPSAHGPFIRVAIRLGGVFVPHLLSLFSSSDPDIRFYSAFLFQELRDPRCMEPLSHLAFDASTDVRVISMRVLETYNRYDGIEQASAVVRSELGAAHRTRQLYAARAVGTLRDVNAIETLVTLLANRDRFIQEAALESLCSITGQQHGLKPHRWKSWYAEHRGAHRVEWIIESLRHRDLPVRRWAHDELIRVTGHRVPFSPLGDRKSRDVAHQAWRQWWERHGRTRLSMRAGG